MMQFILQCEINSYDWLGNKEVLKKNTAYPKATWQQQQQKESFPKAMEACMYLQIVLLQF